MSSCLEKNTNVHKIQELFSTNNSSFLSCKNVIFGPSKASASDQNIQRTFSRSSVIFLLYSYCTPTLGTKLDVFGLYFCFDSFKYINFNLKITLPLLLSEQTSVLGKVFEFIFPARVLNKQITVYKDTSSVDVFLAEIGLSPILFFNLQSIRLA